MERRERKVSIRNLAAFVALLLLAGIGMNGCEQVKKVNTAQNDAGKASDKHMTLNVQWPSPEMIKQGARNMLSAENLKIVDQAPVPVLVPNDPKMLKVGTMMMDNNWYAFSAYDDGVGWSIEGMKRVFRAGPNDLPNDPPSGKSIRGKNIYITDNEIGWRASWNENGIFYGMVFGCDREKEDPRCKDDRLIRQIAENAIYVGGREK